LALRAARRARPFGRRRETGKRSVCPWCGLIAFGGQPALGLVGIIFDAIAGEHLLDALEPFRGIERVGHVGAAAEGKGEHKDRANRANPRLKCLWERATPETGLCHSRFSDGGFDAVSHHAP
jgi:hypothetical protein